MAKKEEPIEDLEKPLKFPKSSNKTIPNNFTAGHGIVYKEEMENDFTVKKDSGSEKNKIKPSWVKMKPDEMEKVIVELAKEGETPAKIGAILRDKHGVPNSRLFGKRVTEVLKEKNVKYKGEKDILNGKVEKLKSHILRNKHDYSASKSLTKKLWVLNKHEKLSIN